MQVRQGCRSSPERARPEDMCRIYGSLSVFAKNVNKCLSFIYILQLSSTSTACQAPRVLVFHQHQDSTVTRRAIPHKGGADISSSLHQECNAAKAMLLFCQAGEVLPIFSYKTSTSAMAFIITFSSAISKQKNKKQKPEHHSRKSTGSQPLSGLCRM